METTQAILDDAKKRMDKSYQFLTEEFSGIRTGKATPSLVENIPIEYYGTQTPLRELSTISTPEPRLITISPFDPSSLDAISKAITAANIGITPMSDGKIIRLPIPELNEERRQEMIKMAKNMAEEQRVAIRNVRRDSNNHIKKLEKNNTINEDERDDTLEEIQELTDKHTQEIAELLEQKTGELSEV